MLQPTCLNQEVHDFNVKFDLPGGRHPDMT